MLSDHEFYSAQDTGLPISLRIDSERRRALLEVASHRSFLQLFRKRGENVDVDTLIDPAELDAWQNLRHSDPHLDPHTDAHAHAVVFASRMKRYQDIADVLSRIPNNTE